MMKCSSTFFKRVVSFGGFTVTQRGVDWLVDKGIEAVTYNVIKEQDEKKLLDGSDKEQEVIQALMKPKP